VEGEYRVPCSGSVGNGEGVPQYGKGECLKKQRSALSKKHYNNARLKSAIGYLAPKDILAGRQQEIHAEQDRKLEEARKQRQIRRQQAA
jgi:hypothetical protein